MRRTACAVLLALASLAAAPDTMRVKATAYCQSGLTKSGMRTRTGIVAADPRIYESGRRHRSCELWFGDIGKQKEKRCAAASQQQCRRAALIVTALGAYPLPNAKQKQKARGNRDCCQRPEHRLCSANQPKRRQQPNPQSCQGGE